MNTRRFLALAAGVLLVPALAGSASGARNGVAAAPCQPKMTPAATHLCGPAKATLSVFPGATFKNGTCKRSNADGQEFLTLELGSLSPRDPAANGKLPYLNLMLSGPAAHPTNGHVNAFWKGKHWTGTGVSFKVTKKGGTFVLKADPPATGKATGSFHC